MEAMVVSTLVEQPRRLPLAHQFVRVEPARYFDLLTAETRATQVAVEAVPRIVRQYRLAMPQSVVVATAMMPELPRKASNPGSHSTLREVVFAGLIICLILVVVKGWMTFIICAII